MQLSALAPTTPLVDDDQIVNPDLVGRLLHAGEGAIFELLSSASPPERANLAMYC